MIRSFRLPRAYGIDFNAEHNPSKSLDDGRNSLTIREPGWMLIVLALSVAEPLCAQTYLVKPVRIIAGYPPGAGNNVIGRMVMTKLSKSLGQQFIVDNRPGASGNIGAEIVARSAPDGYTLLSAPGSIAMSYSLFSKLTYDLLRDFEPIAVMASVPFLFVVHPSLPVKSVKVSGITLN